MKQNYSKASASLSAVEGFEEFYRKWLPYARRVASRMLPCHDDAEDAASAVLLRLWETDSWKVIRHPRTFLTRAVQWEVRRVQLERQRSVAVAETLVDRAILPDEATVRGELHAAVRASLCHLPPRCAAVMTLILEEGVSQGEAAQRLGIGIEAVRRQYVRARRLLGTHLSHFEDGGG